jgi:hypothetical protein
MSSINRIAKKNILKSLNIVKWTRSKVDRISEGIKARIMITLFESDLSNFIFKIKKKQI